MHSLSHTNCNYALLSLLLWYDQFQWCFTHITGWRHQMKTFSALLVLCAENSPVTGEFPSQGWVNNRDVGDLGAIVLIMASPYWFRVYLSRCQSSDGREIWVNLPALYGFGFSQWETTLQNDPQTPISNHNRSQQSASHVHNSWERYILIFDTRHGEWCHSCSAVTVTSFRIHLWWLDFPASRLP